MKWFHRSSEGLVFQFQNGKSELKAQVFFLADQSTFLRGVTHFVCLVVVPGGDHLAGSRCEHRQTETGGGGCL